MQAHTRDDKNNKFYLDWEYADDVDLDKREEINYIRKHIKDLNDDEIKEIANIIKQKINKKENAKENENIN